MRQTKTVNIVGNVSTGCSLPYTSFLSLPAELRNQIYNLVYSDSKNLSIRLSSAYDTKIEFRRKTSDELRTAHSLNRVCRLVFLETHQLLARLYQSVFHEVLLLTKADKDVFLAFRRTISGEGMIDEGPEDLLELPPPPLLLTYLKVTLHLYSKYWPLIDDLRTPFPVLENLELDIMTLNEIPVNKSTNLRREFDGFVDDLITWIHQLTGHYKFRIWRISTLRLMEIRRMSRDDNTDAWNLKYRRLGYSTGYRLLPGYMKQMEDDHGQPFLNCNSASTL